MYRLGCTALKIVASSLRLPLIHAYEDRENYWAFKPLGVKGLTGMPQSRPPELNCQSSAPPRTAGARFLAPYAAHSEASRGRFYPEPGCPMRTPYQRDRDRIVHASAF